MTARATKAGMPRKKRSNEKEFRVPDVPQDRQSPELPPTTVVKNQPVGADSRFATLMRGYDELDNLLAALKEQKKEKEEQAKNLKGLMRDEMVNMGFGHGSTVRVEGVGTFGFTTEAYFNVPAANREQFVQLLIERGEISLLTIGKKDLQSWCKDMKETGQAVPDYITFHEDKLVPRIQLESAKARRQRARAAKK